MNTTKLFFMSLLSFLGSMLYAQTNLALGKTVSSSSVLNGANPNSNLTDGNFNTFAQTNNTFTPPNAEYFQIDLGADYLIEDIVLGSVLPDNGRSRRFMLVTWPSAVGGSLGADPNTYVSGSNNSYLYNRLIYTNTSGTSDVNIFGGTVPAADASKQGPAFPSGQINIKMGKHKARYILLLNLQDDFFQFTEVQVFNSTPAIRSFINQGFESANGGTNPSFVREGDVLGWSTTEAVAMNNDSETTIPTQGSFIEFISSGQFSGVNAYEGNKFVELNAFTNSMLEQEPICVLPGESFNWSFAHRGRLGVDKMGLRIDDVNVATFEDNNAQGGTHLRTLLGSSTINTGLGQDATTANGWTRYFGTWTNTSSVSKSVLFGFFAIQTATAQLSVGNLIDDVRITSLNAIANLENATATGSENVPSANLPKLLINGNVTAASTVTINITGGTAIRGTDYTTVPATGAITVTIPAGNYDGTAATGISLAPYIQINTDVVTDPNETIIFNIASPTGNLLIAPSNGCVPQITTHTYTITDVVGVCNISASNPDSDGDGISNACDLDDDNDGILDVNEARTAGTANWTSTQITNIETTAFTTTVAGCTNVGFKLNDLTNQVANVVANTTVDFGPVLTQDLGVSTSLNPVAIFNLDSPNNANLANITYTVPAGRFESFNVYLADAEHTSFLIQAYDASNNLIPTTDWSSATFEQTNPAIPANQLGAITFNATSARYTAIDVTQDRDVFRIRFGEATMKIATRIVITMSRNDSAITNQDGVFFFVSGVCLGDTDGDGIADKFDLDSDNDGCLDAIEGGANITASQLVTSAGTVSVGTGSTASNQNLCAANTCVNSNGIPQLSPLPTGYSNTTGQTVGGSSDGIQSADCITVCYETPTNLTSSVPVKHGITVLGRAGADNGNWPMLRNSAYTALEGKTKGFVVTRNSSPETTITNPVVGMMVFDTNEGATGCLKIYTGSAVGEGWKCFSTQTCP
ncbi:MULTISPECIES: thrombospondin type 3 repeat-containing protein [Chryseobacterium]|jgi:hypothetical protein|uniref:F5/8 type C domain-containing protein n=2 Tax=Chryseobacterium aquaticum TaxID=452084 RepID=A0A101CEY9_9FLAO|nr:MULTISPECIES: thrombospondin type 3 repeat-containing protein [Chryseobacterium]KNB61486.1 hypothetical protein AC804_09010 [Chryseobacterium sp. Hurlbut01]KUJ55008.1 hypothetical protein AR686_15760 [Chryseobacterium aquaticum subsp. greenlandense]